MVPKLTEIGLSAHFSETFEWLIIIPVGGLCMRQAFNQQRIESVWKEKASAAIDRRDEDGYRSAMVNLRVVQVLYIARHENWSSWKSRSVCKYVQKTFETMSIAELSVVNDQAVQDLIDHAATGFDSHARRAGR